MVCYDGFFPEVARQLAIRGAEVIAWPVGAAIRTWPRPGRWKTTCTW